jgi:subtilisin family serine protease
MFATFRFRASSLALVAGAALVFAGPARAQAPRTSSLTVSPDGTSARVTVGGAGAPQFAPSRVIVRFRTGTSFLPGSGRSVSLAPALNVHLVDNPPGLSVAQVIGRYQASPNVLYAEPDYTVNAILTPNDPAYVPSQWDMTKISSPAAWGIHTDSSTVVVAIVDTGIDYTHPDLQGNVYTDSGNSSVHGYSCMNGSCVAGGADDFGHGTHVAGTIGAATNNSVGMAGLNWSVKLLSVKFLNSSGSGSISDAVLAFNLLKTMKQAGVNIRVTNNSWGGGGFTQSLQDAMAALEVTPGYPSTLDVCAAGNSGVNADFTPMYPAAYDNRGIISVLASDSSDVGAGFTNFGLASVDIAAPGVSTYSTVPTGSCSLCDPSGYKLLSGTSMATPHVAGVAAALLSIDPALTAAQARDAILNPNSYDTLSDARAQSTSSGGRLNFFKTITNTGFLSNPVLNQFPTVTVGPDAFVSGGATVNFSATASDPDGDTLRVVTGRGSASASSAWLVGWELNQLFPSTVPFVAPSIAHDAVMSYATSVADNRGGGASGQNWAVVSGASSGGPPAGALTVPATGSINVPVTIGFSGSDPDGFPIGWDLWASGLGGSSGICCYTGSSASLTFSSAGVYRISVQAVDKELNTSTPQTAMISIGGAPGIPPVAVATLDKQSGPVPLTVNINMSGSFDPDGSIAYYFLSCGGGLTVGSSGATGSCSFTTPGTYWLLLQVQDNAGLMGLVSKYVVAEPIGGGSPPPSDSTPPTVSMASPSPGASLAGTVNLQSSASDNSGGSGVKEVQYYLDSTAAGASLGKAIAAPYTVSWNASLVALGSHTIYAIARDNSGNASSPASVAVTVTAVVLPTVSLSPAGSVTVSKRSTLTMTATTNTPTYSIARIDFLVGTTVVCSASSAANPCLWKAPAASKTYKAQAKVYDSKGNVGSSNVLSISVK